jgi:hypothetical protein
MTPTLLAVREMFAALPALPAIAAAQAPTTFSHFDWELACDGPLPVAPPAISPATPSPAYPCC